MIIQSTPDGTRHFAITMDQHTALAARFARAFGNPEFEPVAPLELMLFMVGNHDKGWVALDAAPGTNPATGLPYNLIETPATDIVPTSAGSPDFNERHHPYCGLLSSMHSWGLYNGRYGLSDKILIDSIPDSHRPLVQRMLDGELARQARLRATLAQDPVTAAWIEDGHLFQNYKQLQFFDTLALYFNRTAEGAREETHFEHVPCDAARDVTITLSPQGPGVYALKPYPFGGQAAEFSFEGRHIAPLPAGTVGDWGARLAGTPIETQHFTLIAA
jgi:hypothetical protein